MIVLRQLQAISIQAEHLIWSAHWLILLESKSIQHCITHHSARVSLMTVTCNSESMMTSDVQICSFFVLFVVHAISTLLVGLQCWLGRETYTSQFPIVQVTLIDKSSMASKKFFVPVSKFKVDGMVVCCVLGWNWSCYMHVGLTLPSCSFMIGQKWPYIPQGHYFMCIKLVATLYMWEESCAACPCLVTISLSCNLYLITNLGRTIEIYVHFLSFLFRYFSWS